jgi:hypothetical protein
MQHRHRPHRTLGQAAPLRGLPAAPQPRSTTSCDTTGSASTSISTSHRARRVPGTHNRRIASRRGPVKVATVAVEHAKLIAIWNMLIDGVFYGEPGGDFYTRRNPDRTKQRGPRPAQEAGLRRHPDPGADRRGRVKSSRQGYCQASTLP